MVRRLVIVSDEAQQGPVGLRGACRRVNTSAKVAIRFQDLEMFLPSTSTSLDVGKSYPLEITPVLQNA